MPLRWFYSVFYGVEGTQRECGDPTCCCGKFLGSNKQPVIGGNDGWCGGIKALWVYGFWMDMCIIPVKNEKSTDRWSHSF